MRKRYLLALFLPVACAQIAIPATMIVQRELTLRDGTLYRFRCTPFERYDALRGRFVALKIGAAVLDSPEATSFYPGQWIHARIEVDDKGFARLVEPSPVRPAHGDYIGGLVRRGYRRGDPFRLSLPFERYYMDERLTPQAERAVRSAGPEGQRETYITVRVRRGNAVLEELYIDDQPILEFLNGQRSAP